MIRPDMITYEILEKYEKPKYQQLYLNLRQDIEEGILKPNDKLPSKRVLAKQLQVSLITVENAYGQLNIEGYISSIEKKGYYVNDIQFQKREHLIMKNIENQIEDKWIVDLTTSANSADYFPFSSYSKLTRKILLERREDILKKSDYRGLEELRKAVASHLFQFMGMKVSPSQIVIGAGSEYLYTQLVQLFGHKVKYALEDPTHLTIAKVYKSNEVDYSFVALDKDGIDLKEIEKVKPQIVHVSSNHHFPTGITMPIARRQQLLDWAYKNKGFIIEDDYDSEFRLKGKPIPPLFALDNSGCVIYLNTFSVSLASSFRIAYMVLPENLLEQYNRKLGFYHCPVANLEQLILSEFISNGSFERYINRMRKRYKEIRDYLVDSIKQSNILNKMKIKEADSGLHLLLVYDNDISDKILEEKARNIGLCLQTLSHYTSQSNDSHSIIIRYTGLDKNKCGLIIKKLEELFQ